jgi:hypothetical protein
VGRGLLGVFLFGKGCPQAPLLQNVPNFSGGGAHKPLFLLNVSCNSIKHFRVPFTKRGAWQNILLGTPLSWGCKERGGVLTILRDASPYNTARGPFSRRVRCDCFIEYLKLHNTASNADWKHLRHLSMLYIRLL